MTPGIRAASAAMIRLRSTCIAAMLAVAAISASSNSASPQTPPTFGTATRLVQVDVVVRGKDGQPVAGLTAGDFRLFDNGTQQAIALFSVESNGGAASAASASRSTAPDRAFNNGVGDANGGATVILLDRLNTAAQDQKFALDELSNVLQIIKPGDRVALYVLAFGSVLVLHDFTDDAAALVRALPQLLTRRKTVRAASGAQPSETTDETLSFDALPQLLVPGTSFGRTRSGIPVRAGPDAIGAANAENRADTTAHALAAIASRLAGLQGRKNLVWVSSGFPLDFEGHESQLVGSDALRQAVAALNDADVAIYPVNAHGVAASFGTDTIGSLQKLAADTGGQAFFNTNDLAGAVGQALDDGRLTYVLGYYPSHGQWDGRFRDIRVTVDRAGVDVRFRKGYLADPRSTMSPELRQGELLKLAGTALEATGLGLTARVDAPAGKNHAAGEISVAIQVAPASISLAKSANGWSGLLDLLVVQTAADGQIFKSFGGAIDFTMPDSRRERFLRDGLRLTRAVILRPDARSLTLMVRDVASGALGSVVIDAEALRHAAATPAAPVPRDATAYSALVNAYRSGRPDIAINQLAAWPLRAVAENARAAAQMFSASDSMAAAILSAEVVDVLVQRADVKSVVESALPLVQAAGADPFGRARGADPRRDWFYTVAATLVSAGQMREALWVIQNGLVMFPEDPMLYFVRGTIAERALFRGPGDLTIYQRRHDALAVIAVADYVRALDADPHLAIANVHVGWVRLALNEWARAREPLEAAVVDAHTDPVRYLALLALGRLNEHDGQLDRARDEYAAAFAIGAGYQTACIALSRVEDLLGNAGEARRVAAQCPPLSGHDDPWWSLAVQFDSDALTQLRAQARLP